MLPARFLTRPPSAPPRPRQTPSGTRLSPAGRLSPLPGFGSANWARQASQHLGRGAASLAVPGTGPGSGGGSGDGTSALAAALSGQSSRHNLMSQLNAAVAAHAVGRSGSLAAGPSSTGALWAAAGGRQPGSAVDSPWPPSAGSMSRGPPPGRSASQVSSGRGSAGGAGEGGGGGGEGGGSGRVGAAGDAAGRGTPTKASSQPQMQVRACAGGGGRGGGEGS
jgi:hypothetical protein